MTSQRGCGAFRDPDTNRSIPGGLRTRSTGEQALRQKFVHAKPSTVIGTSPARSAPLSRSKPSQRAQFLQFTLLNSPEAYIQFKPGLITDDGEVTIRQRRIFAHLHGRIPCFISRCYMVCPERRQLDQHFYARRGLTAPNTSTTALRLPHISDALRILVCRASTRGARK